MTLSVLQRLIITELVDQAASAQGVSVTQGEIDTAQQQLEAQLGGPEALVAAYLDADVPLSGITRQVELSLQVQLLGATLALRRIRMASSRRSCSTSPASASRRVWR